MNNENEGQDAAEEVTHQQSNELADEDTKAAEGTDEPKAGGTDSHVETENHSDPDTHDPKPDGATDNM